MNSIPAKTCASCGKSMSRQYRSVICKTCLSICDCGNKKDFRAQACASCACRSKALAQWADTDSRAVIVNGLHNQGPRDRRSWGEITEQDFNARKSDGRFKAYYHNGTKTVMVYRNIWRWTLAHGAITRGMHIHHINEDCSDDRIENLQLLTATQHLRQHMTDTRIRGMVEARGERIVGKTEYRCAYCDRVFEKRRRINRPNKYCSVLCRDNYSRNRPKY